jgi:eukaryotic-like serine/threonine-protein kinase
VLSGLQDVSETIAAGESLVTALRSAVECIHRGFGFARSVLLLNDPVSTAFRARIWCGDADKEQLHLLQFNSASTTDLFALACARGVDVQIIDTEDPSLSEKLPGWMKRACPSARSFIILPVIHKGRPVGCLYLERNCIDTRVSTEELTLLQTVKNHVLLALRTIKV